MAYKPPYSVTSMFFAGPKEHGRMARENTEYRKGFVRGQGHADGQRSRRTK